MHYFQKYLVTPKDGSQPTGAETIERLCDRAQSSTLLDDRRDSIRALKSLSRKFRIEVGSQAMGILMNVLSVDRSDSEIVGYALDTLCHICSNELFEEELAIPDIPPDIGSQFTEMMIKDEENAQILLSLLEEYDFHVRWPTVKLLTVLLTNKSKDMQEIILVSPMGVPKLIDLLSDSREIIRNDGLLLLIQLTKGNANIQKIVAFENAFERCLEIIRDEGMSDGGIVVEDCLLLLLNLLRNNSSNQNFFKEGSFIKHLQPFFELQAVDQSPQGGWSAQKVTNIHLMLQLVRTLVSPGSPVQQISACQEVMNQSGLLQQLCTILMASGVPADVLTETINTVSEVIRGNHGNQEYFASVMAPSNPPRPAIVVLLMSMVNEKQPFVLRCAVLYCFQSFLYKNETGQLQVVQTLLPSTADVNNVSAGQLLCGGLFSFDSVSTWLAAVALLHSITSNLEQKEQLLRVQLATNLGNPPVSLLQQCSNILSKETRLQTRVGLLMLLACWLMECPTAVKHFLQGDNNVAFLISQVSASEGDELELLVQGLCAFLLGLLLLFNSDEVEGYTISDLCQIIEKRIGTENFQDKIGQVSKSEFYSKAAKRPHLDYKQPNDVLFDYEFCRLFKSLENDVYKSVASSKQNGEDLKKKQQSVEEHESIVEQYKGLIREQDIDRKRVEGELSELRAEHSKAEKDLEEFAQQVQQLKDQNSLLKAQRGNHGSAAGENNDITKLHQEVEQHKKALDDKDQLIEKLKNELTISEAKSLVQSAGEENGVGEPPETAVLQASVKRLTSEVDELKAALSQKDEELHQSQAQFNDTNTQLQQLRERATMTPASQDQSASNPELEGKLSALEEQHKKMVEEKASLQERLTKTNQDSLKQQEKYNKLEEDKNKVLGELKESQEECEGIKKEQEDLLVLLADQDTKIANYKDRLCTLGEKVDDDEEEDDLEFDDDELDED